MQGVIGARRKPWTKTTFGRPETAGSCVDRHAAAAYPGSSPLAKDPDDHPGYRLLIPVALTVIALHGCRTAAPFLSALQRFYLDSARANLNGRIYDMAELRAAERHGDAKLRGQDIGPFQKLRFCVSSCVGLRAG